MHDRFCSFRRLARVTVLLAFPAAAALGQATTDLSAGPPPATAVQAAADEDACPPMAVTDIPFNQTLRVKVTGLLDSGRLKPGKEIWLKMPSEENSPGCTLDADATVYAHITVASSNKNPNSSQLGLTIDHADCAGHAKQEFKMRIVGVVWPQNESGSLHDAMASGRGRQISVPAAEMDGMDAQLNPRRPAGHGAAGNRGGHEEGEAGAAGRAQMQRLAQQFRTQHPTGGGNATHSGVGRRTVELAGGRLAEFAASQPMGLHRWARKRRKTEDVAGCRSWDRYHPIVYTSVVSKSPFGEEIYACRPTFILPPPTDCSGRRDAGISGGRRLRPDCSRPIHTRPSGFLPCDGSH